jgi:hypothetical protein
MIRLGRRARFTVQEVDEFRQVGLDVSSVKHQKDIEQELTRWARALSDERPGPCFAELFAQAKVLRAMCYACTASTVRTA